MSAPAETAPQGAPASLEVAPAPSVPTPARRATQSRVVIAVLTIAALRGIVALGRLTSDPMPDIHADPARFQEITDRLGELQAHTDALPERALERTLGPADATVTLSQAETSVRGLCRQEPGLDCVTARAVLEDLRDRTFCTEARQGIGSLLMAAEDRRADPAVAEALEASAHDLRGVCARICGTPARN